MGAIRKFLGRTAENNRQMSVGFLTADELAEYRRLMPGRKVSRFAAAVVLAASLLGAAAATQCSPALEQPAEPAMAAPAQGMPHQAIADEDGRFTFQKYFRIPESRKMEQSREHFAPEEVLGFRAEADTGQVIPAGMDVAGSATQDFLSRADGELARTADESLERAGHDQITPDDERNASLTYDALRA